jgi:hypothetical protein
MKHLSQFVVETPAGETFKVYAANAFDAGKQVMQNIMFKNTLVERKYLVKYGKLPAPN